MTQMINHQHWHVLKNQVIQFFQNFVILIHHTQQRLIMDNGSADFHFHYLVLIRP